MKTLGNEIYIQRGENWTLDIEVKNEQGDPYMMFLDWKNPFVAITVASARYQQKGDFRRTWWLDMNKKQVQTLDGQLIEKDIKRFIETQALYVEEFDTDEIMSKYGANTGNGHVLINPDSPFDIKNYLFYTDVHGDGNKIYKYITHYNLDINRQIADRGTGIFVEGIEILEEDVDWEEYNFRIVKQFRTQDWVEQGYLFDIKLLSGITTKEYIRNILITQGEEVPDLPWTDAETVEQIKRITDKKTKKIAQNLFESGQPLAPDYDTKNLILNPTNLIVSANIQGVI